MILRPPRSTLSSSSAASDVYKRQVQQQPEDEAEEPADEQGDGDHPEGLPDRGEVDRPQRAPVAAHATSSTTVRPRRSAISWSTAAGDPESARVMLPKDRPCSAVMPPKTISKWTSLRRTASVSTVPRWLFWPIWTDTSRAW